MNINQTKTIDGLTVTVSIKKEVEDRVSYADGYNVSVGKQAEEFTTISFEKNGVKGSIRDTNFFYILEDSASIKKTMPTAYARFGDKYLSEASYKIIKQIFDEAMSLCEETEEYVSLNNAEAKPEEEKAINAIFEGKTQKEISALEAQYDNINNEGAEGFNPYRMQA